MKRHKALQGVSLIFAILALVAAPISSLGRTPRPSFAGYRVRERFRGRPAPVDLSSQGARYFRTRLREGARKGPNFAGHYTVVTWGCGSDCVDISIVDAKTGKVWFAPFTGAIGVEFHRDSRLFVVDPQSQVTKVFPDGLPSGMTAPEVFFVWRQNRFIQIYPRDGTKPLPAIR